MHVRRSASEAHDAARLGRTVLGPCHIARPSDLGVYRLLLALRLSGDLEPFVKRTLEPLLRDERHSDTLVETLEAFFAQNGNSTRAADTLHLHRNSLLYRLHQARELLGQDLDDPELRLSLQLAIKGLRVLRLQEERERYGE
jgi:purine catabolism regulator